MTKTFRVLVLFGAFLTAVSAGPIVESSESQPQAVVPEELGDGLPVTYFAFMELAEPSWVIGPVAATFDSTMLYASQEGLAPTTPDPLAEPITFVPEPRAVALLAFGLAILFLLGIRRRRRSHSHNL